MLSALLTRFGILPLNVVFAYRSIRLIHTGDVPKYVLQVRVSKWTTTAIVTTDTLLLVTLKATVLCVLLSARHVAVTQVALPVSVDIHWSISSV